MNDQLKQKAIWKDIQNYEGLYQVSNMGQVRNKSGLTLKNVRLAGGYVRVTLCKSGVNHHRLIHRLVCGAFLDNPLKLPQVNHKDGNKLNNHVGNLEWVTERQNMHHAIKKGFIKKQGSDNPRAKLTEQNVRDIRKLRENTNLTLKEIGSRFGITDFEVSLIARRVRWSHLI